MKTKRRLFVWIVIVLLILPLTASCASESSLPTQQDSPTSQADQERSQTDAAAFSAQYIRTDGYRDDITYPLVKLIRSADELQAYYDANKDWYDLSRREGAASGTTVGWSEGFLNACDRYDATYFEEKMLAMVLLEEDSGSTRHEVTRIRRTNEQLRIEIDTTTPEAGTCDMAVWHILIELTASMDVASEQDVTVFVDGVSTSQKLTIAECKGDYANMSLLIPDGWEYAVFDEGDIARFSISFWPVDHSEGKLTLDYYATGFGVCGTDLEEIDITLGEYAAYQGTYGQRSVWDFICFEGMPGDYVVMNEGADSWWDDHGEEAMAILNTVTLADGILRKDQAIAVAEEKVHTRYEQANAVFQYDKGIWRIQFSNADGDGCIVTVSTEGDILDVTDTA